MPNVGCPLNRARPVWRDFLFNHGFHGLHGFYFFIRSVSSVSSVAFSFSLLAYSKFSDRSFQIQHLEYSLCHFSAFRPEKGTPFFGYRSPEASFHWDILDKGTDIYRRYGFTTLQLHSGPASGPHSAQLFQIKNGEFTEEGKLTQWKFPSLD